MQRTVDKYYKLNKNPFELINCQEKLKGETTIDICRVLYKDQCFNLITGRNEVLAEVMFLHVSVILLTGGCLPGGGVPPNFQGGLLQIFGGGVSAWRGVPPNFWGRGCLPGGGVPPNFRWRGSSKFFWGGGSPLEYGQRSAGTHPTGMHSCFF